MTGCAVPIIYSGYIETGKNRLAVLNGSNIELVKHCRRRVCLEKNHAFQSCIFDKRIGVIWKSRCRNKICQLEVIALRNSIMNKKIMTLVFCCTALMFVWGCAGGVKNEKRDAFFEKWTTLAENSQGHSPTAKTKKIDTSALIAKKSCKSIVGEVDERQRNSHIPHSSDHAPGGSQGGVRAMAKR
jgi:hypothetical protein